MKLGIMDWVVPGRTIGERFKNASRYGLDGIEVFLSEGDDLAKAEKELRDAQQSTGLEILVTGILGPKFCTAATDEKSLQDKLDVHKAAIQLSAKVGGLFNHIVAEYAAQFVDLAAMSSPTAEEEAYFFKFLTQLSDFAQGFDIPLVIEPINRYETHYYRRIGEVREVCQKVGKPNIKGIADFFHMDIEEPDVAAAIRQNADCIGHVHVGENNRSFPGEAHLDFAPGFKALREIGYDQYITFEIQGDYVTEPDRQIPQAIEYVKKLWQQS